jgi:hypothetical protein
MARWHPNVDDDEFWLPSSDELDQVRSVPDLPGNLETRAFEQAHQSLSEKNLVLCHRHPDAA